MFNSAENTLPSGNIYLPHIFIVFLIGFLISGCSNNEHSITPEIRNITESVYASVTIEPDSMYQVYATVSGLITQIHVKEGDKVTKDQRIAQIKNASSKLNLDNARLTLQLANDNLYGNGSLLNSLKDKIQAARITHIQDSIDYKRQKRLWEQNIGTAKQFDQSKLAFEVSKQNLSSLEKEYSRTENELKKALKSARNNYENARIGKEDFTITSQLNGRVYDLFKEQGELIGPQEPLATIGISNSFKIKMLIDEVDINKIKAGQKVIIKLDAFDDNVFNAIVTRILPQKNTRTQTFLIEADFIKPPENLYSGLSGEANIIISQKETSVIPRRYLLENNTVETKEGPISVEVGITTMEYVEILSGIDSTTQLYLP